jgi:hypothetical protein
MPLKAITPFSEVPRTLPLSIFTRVESAVAGCPGVIPVVAAKSTYIMKITTLRLGISFLAIIFSFLATMLVHLDGIDDIEAVLTYGPSLLPHLVEETLKA